MERTETIAAIATAPGRGGIAVIRVSGPDAFPIAHTLTGREVEPGRFIHAAVRDAAGRLLDHALILAFPHPHSYTGEDVVEFQSHGGIVTPRRILEACFAAGARLADRGEFTLRAFLNGKLDLSEAESVIELVDAKTDRAADDALARQNGNKTREYNALYERALELSTTLEHSLDISEDELPAGFLEDLREKSAALEKDILQAARRAHEGRLLREGALVVLAGPPNAGKSSLMNTLLGENRVLVSPTPGTTRDSIEEMLDLDGWPVRLVDTAGLRTTADAIEEAGVNRAHDLIARADIVLYLLGDEQESAATAADSKTIRVQSKCDVIHSTHPNVLRVSSVTGEGLDKLKAALVAKLETLAEVRADSTASASEREGDLLQSAAAHLAALDTTEPILLANALRATAQTLGALTGREYASDMLTSLFSRFCVGK